MSITMKTIKQILFITLLLVSYNHIIAQNLSSMSVIKRDSMLIAISKDAILKFGPDYYREYKPPVIIKGEYPPKGINNPDGINAGRGYYTVTYLYDKTKETLNWDYAAKVSIWADTGNLDGVMFGCGLGLSSINMDWRNDMTIKPVPYYDATKPIPAHISIIISDSIIEEQARKEYYQQALEKVDREPVSKDKLTSNGWARRRR